MLIRWLAFLLLTVITLAQNILTTVEFIKNVVFTSNSIPSNFVGLSFSFPQIYNDMYNALLTGYIKNSFVYGSSNAGFRISMKMQYPKGFKSNCSAYASINPNMTCTRDLLNNSDFTNLNAFARATLPRAGLIFLGMDTENGNFSNSTFVNNVYGAYNRAPISTLMYFGGWFGILQVYDQADLYQARDIRKKFTPNDFKVDADPAYMYSNYYLAGPGLSINCSKEWIDTVYDWSFNGYGFFTLYAQPFTNPADVTISNLLNQAYYRPYIQNRLTGTGGVIDPTYNKMAFTDVRIVGGDGVSGVTDTMAAALWALDFAMECAMFGLQYILFNNDVGATNVQSPLGNTPNYTPRGSYYGMLMMSMINNWSYKFTTQTVTAGTSGSIKIYGFYLLSQQGFLLINKDTNPSASGVVQINAASSYNMSCMYMSASSLSSKNISIAGYYFVQGNSTAQGSFAMFNYTPDDTGYKVPLNYSQAAYCTTLVTSYLFSKDVLTTSSEGYHQLLAVIISLLLFLFF